MIDPGKFHDWLEARFIDLTQRDEGFNGGEKISRERFEELFRQYVIEVTSR